MRWAARGAGGTVGALATTSTTDPIISRSVRTALVAALGLALSVFICHKQVMAAPIVAADPVAHALTIMLPNGEPHTFAPAADFFARSTPTVGDYFVVYDDGYQSHSPAAAFEAGYHPGTDGMTFGDAIDAMKAGKRVARAGWNGKGMWIAYTPGSEFSPAFAKVGHAATFRAAEAPDEPIRLGAHIDMRAADGSMVVGWLASQTDMLAEDWVVVT